MKRRSFLLQGSLLTTGLSIQHLLPSIINISPRTDSRHFTTSLYDVFKNPADVYRPYVRWWWNGDKVEATELSRELHLLKEAGIGGVEINPIKFPERTNSLNISSVQWLSEEWIELFQSTCIEANSLGLTCDLIIGSGWPFGAEWLQGEERSQVVVIGTKKLEGPLQYEVSIFELLKEADPAISASYTGRRPEILSLILVPDPLTNKNQIKDLNHEINKKFFTLDIPPGEHVLYALVHIHSFMEVINGAPGANGPVLNHYNEAAVKKYLNRMTDTIQKKTGPLSNHVRAFFTDSLELEGANWCSDMMIEFKKRRGYDLFPYLPFLMFKTGSMGNTWDYNYGTGFNPEFKDMIQRMRYDFELTKTELLEERFLNSFIEWCKQNKVKSRVQAYGRGYFPLEGSFDIDLPECETWIRHGIGKEMSEEDYRIGRGYTMINKYVSSAAHLKNKKYISAEELTNIDRVFNESLELCKITGDQSTISGVTHPIFHGFNYSPPNAPFPGWVRYGTFFSERNPWWPYLKYYNTYRARISAILQQATMFADIAVLPPIPDLWSLYGAQNEPFPSLMHPTYQTLIWESIHQNGNGCDYISEQVIRESIIRNGYLIYGQRKYHTIFLIEVLTLEPATAKKLYEFVQTGGRVFCIEEFPDKSPGWNAHLQRDDEVRNWVHLLKNYPSRFILLQKPVRNFTLWYRDIQLQYNIIPYLKINEPNPFITQVRYRADKADLFFIINSNADNAYTIDLSFTKEITHKKYGWIWDPENGERYRIETGSGKFTLELGPAESKLLVFDSLKSGKAWNPLPTGSSKSKQLLQWTAECRHINGAVSQISFDALKDLKDVPDLLHFSGTIMYHTSFDIKDPTETTCINLGKVEGVSELIVNGINCGVQWYGRRIYLIGDKIKTGNNTLEVRVTTGLLNYMKSLKDNPVAQYWTNEGRRNQPYQSMGLIGPVSYY